jgi:hypothetical protein
MQHLRSEAVRLRQHKDAHFRHWLFVSERGEAGRNARSARFELGPIGIGIILEADNQTRDVWRGLRFLGGIRKHHSGLST